MTALDLWIVAGYLAASLVVGMALARRASGSLEDFFVGGRALPWWLAGTSMAATTFSIDTPLYVAGVVGTRGIAGNWEWWSFGVAHVVLLYVFARLWRRAEVVTDNELSELRYGGRSAAVLRGVKGFLFAGILGPISLGLSMLAMVKVIDALEVLPALGFTGAQDRLWAVVGVSVLVLIYAGLSGLWGVVVTDFVQFVLGLLGALVVAWSAVSHLGGLEGLVAAAGAVERVDLLSFTPLTWGDGGRIVWSTAAGISASTFLAYVGLQWWAFRRSDGGGEFVQRLAAARTEADAQKAAWLFNLLHYVVRTWPWIVVALAAVVLYPDLADPELGYPRLMLDFLPAGILGLVVASLVAAFMSTVSTTINWSASYLTHDLYVRFARPRASSRERVVAARVASVVVTALGAAAAFYSENVTTLFRLIIAVGTGPGLVLILRWFWWRVNAPAELAAMVAGFLVGLGTSVVPVLTIADFGLRLLVTAGVTTAVWLPVMWLTRPESDERLDEFYRKVRPGGPGWAVQRARTGVQPDGSLGADLTRVGAGLLILFGAMFAVGGAVLLRPGTAAASLAALLLGVGVLRWANARRAAAAVVLLLAFAAGGGGGPVAAQVVELEPGEGAGVPLTAWLAGRFPGLQVLASSGSPGAAPRLRVRGVGSLSVSNEPVVVLDGLRVESGARSTTLGVGGQAPSRLDDIAVESLARVEVLRGPEAGARWGAGAGAGVVLLTSRARAGGGHGGLRSWVSAGRVRDVASRPANWFGRDGTGACFAWEVADGRCTQTELQRFAPFDAAEARPFATRLVAAAGAVARHAMGAGALEVGGAWQRDDGVTALPEFEADAPHAPPGGRERLGADLGLALPLGEGGRLHLEGHVVRRVLERVVDGNDFAGLHATGLLGFAEGGAEADYGYRLFRPSQVYARRIDQETDRAILTAQAAGRVGPLDVVLELGLDAVDRLDTQFVPPGVVALGSSLPRGVADRNRTTVDGRSGRLAVALDWGGGGLRGRTTVSADAFASTFERDDLHGEGLAPGASTPEEAADTRRLRLDGTRRIVGGAVEQELAMGRGVRVRGGVRMEENRTLGRTLDRAVLPFVALDLAPARSGPVAGWWPDRLTLRGGWGRGVAVPDADGRDLDRVALAPAAADPPLERSTQVEVGAAYATADGVLTVDAAVYRRTTDDLLLRTPLLFSQAADGAVYAPVGAVVNRGLELAATAVLLDDGPVRWTAQAVASFVHNEVTRLAADADIRQGLQRTVPGHPLGGYWDRPLTFDDRDGDGVIVPSEVSVGTEARYLGSPHPSREVGVGTRLRMGSVTAFAHLLHRGGHRLRNLTEGYRCQVTLCRGFNDPSAPLGDQARALPPAVFPPDFVTEAGFVEDASFWRLSEAGVRWALPGAWPGTPLLSVSGTNLALFTDYSGMDPEVNQFGATEVLARDFMTQPPVRRWTVRLDVSGPSW